MTDNNKNTYKPIITREAAHDLITGQLIDPKQKFVGIDISGPGDNSIYHPERWNTVNSPSFNGMNRDIVFVFQQDVTTSNGIETVTRVVTVPAANLLQMFKFVCATVDNSAQLMGIG